MKNITRRRLSTLIAIVMVLTLSITTPLTVLAQNDSTVQNAEVANDELVVTDTDSTDAEAVEEVVLGNELLDSSDTTWQNSFRYATSGSSIVLRGYTGSAIEVNIPATAKINGDTYNVMLDDDCSYFFNGGSGLGNRTTKSIQFDPAIDTSNVTNMSHMFYNYCALTSLDISNFKTGNVNNMSYMFDGCLGLTELDLRHFDTSNVTNMSYMFYACSGLNSLDVSSFDTTNVTNMRDMFGYCTKLTSLNVSDFRTENVKNMSNMFYECESIRNLNLSNFNTSNVTNMTEMFRDCYALRSLNISGFKTGNVTSINNMFRNCYVLQSIDVSEFDTHNVTDMDQVFLDCYAVKSLDLSKFDTSKVTTMHGLFWECRSLTNVDVSRFDTRKVTDMTGMFYHCKSLENLDTSSFDMSNTTGKTSYMLSGCNALSTIKIPLKLQDTVNLPKTFIRQDNPDISYTELPKNEGESYTIVAIVPVTGVSVNPISDTLYVGESVDLAATVLPTTATNKNVAWSSNNTSVATVDNNGTVTAVSAGHATITVTTEDGAHTAECIITVKQHVTGVTVDPTTKSLNVGESYNLAATVEPATATNKNVTWSSSDSTVVSVDNTGKITALKDGSATITVRTEDGGKTATCTVTVNDVVVPVEGVAVSPTSKTIGVGESYDLTAQITPTNATNKKVTWSSNKPEIVKVDANGKITAVSKGEVVITVTTEDGNFTAKCNVTVDDSVAVTGVTVSPSSKTLGVGERFGLAATVTPANATNKKVTWSSNKPSVATVDSNGKVTAVSQGEAVITVITEDGNFASVCNVTVKSSRIPATGISVTPTSKTLNVADTFNISATITPANATDKRIIWNSSNPKIATVDDYGNVKALRPGHVIITASSVSGDHTAACEVTVVEKLGPTIDIYRLYNPITGEHFYTGDESEIRNMVAVGWIDEGYAWTAPASSERAVYRLYNSTSDSHHYTSDEAEKQNLLSLGWIYEKICWYSNNFGNAGVALYRLFNANASTAASHFYTSDLTERNNLMNLGWKYEGIGWYGI